MMALLLKGVLAYLLGSLVASLLLSRLMGGTDLRTVGSGNAGAANALRTKGIKAALPIFAIDLAKGWIATGLLAPWVLPGLPVEGDLAAWDVPLCGIAVVLGHVYPLWFSFRGGKGVATVVGTVLGFAPALLIPMTLTWLIVVIVLGYVGLASMLGAIALVISLIVRGAGAPLITFGVLAAALILYAHRANIARMRAGTENRAKRLWLFRTRKGAA
jgi:acyl phosphate:glycerol-3-phosphate acyltransferase